MTEGTVLVLEPRSFDSLSARPPDWQSHLISTTAHRLGIEAMPVEHTDVILLFNLTHAYTIRAHPTSSPFLLGFCFWLIGPSCDHPLVEMADIHRCSSFLYHGQHYRLKVVSDVRRAFTDRNARAFLEPGSAVPGASCPSAPKTATVRS